MDRRNEEEIARLVAALRKLADDTENAASANDIHRVIWGLQVALPLACLILMHWNFGYMRRPKKMSNSRGFTLIELMITVAIIGILAAIAIPNFAKAITKSQEAMTIGNLGTLRSALAVYYADTEGMRPMDDLQSLILGSKYLRAIPTKHTPPYHPEGHSVGGYADFSAMAAAREDWFYINAPGLNFGTIVVNCDHQDLSGRVWSSY